MEERGFYNDMWDNSPMGRMGCGTPIAVAIFIGILFFLTSCATKTIVEYKDRDVNQYITQYVHDTLRIKESDSIHHEIRVVNDTVYDTKYIEKTRWRDRIVTKTDTCYRDSIQTVIKKTDVEKKVVPKWCYYLLVFSILVIIFSIIKVIRWLQIH